MCRGGLHASCRSTWGSHPCSSAASLIVATMHILPLPNGETSYRQPGASLNSPTKQRMKTTNDWGGKPAQQHLPMHLKTGYRCLYQSAPGAGGWQLALQVPALRSPPGCATSLDVDISESKLSLIFQHTTTTTTVCPVRSLANNNSTGHELKK